MLTEDEALHKLATVMAHMGYDTVDTLIRECLLGRCPSICTNPHCDHIEMMPLTKEGWCPLCNERSMQNPLYIYVPSE